MADIELIYECQSCGARSMVKAPPCIALVAFGYCAKCSAHVDDYDGIKDYTIAFNGDKGCELARERTAQAIADGRMTAAFEVQALCSEGPVCTIQDCDHPDKWCPFDFRPQEQCP